MDFSFFFFSFSLTSFCLGDLVLVLLVSFSFLGLLSLSLSFLCPSASLSFFLSSVFVFFNSSLALSVLYLSFLFSSSSIILSSLGKLNDLGCSSLCFMIFLSSLPTSRHLKVMLYLSPVLLLSGNILCSATCCVSPNITNVSLSANSYFFAMLYVPINLNA